MAFSVDADGLYGTGTVTIDGAEFDATELSTAVAAAVTAAEATLAQVREVFAVNCTFSGCHSGGEPAAGLSLEGDFAARIVGVDSGQLPDFKLVEPGNPTKS